MSDRIIDMDAARKARSEAKGVKPTVKFGGKVFELPLELPFEVAEAATSSNTNSMFEAIKVLVGTDQWKQFQDLGISIDDVGFLLENIAEIYGVDQGN